MATLTLTATDHNGNEYFLTIGKVVLLKDNRGTQYSLSNLTNQGHGSKAQRETVHAAARSADPIAELNKVTYYTWSKV